MIVVIRCSACQHAKRPCPRCFAAVDHPSGRIPSSSAPIVQLERDGSTYVVPTPDGWPGVMLVETRDRWTGGVRW